MKDKRIIIIGSAGALGRHVVEKAIASFGVESIVLSDYKPNRLEAQREGVGTRFGISPSTEVIDIRSPESIRRGLDTVDLVIVATQQIDPLIQCQCIAQGIDSIDLSVDPRFIEKALALNATIDNRSTHIVTGGLFPGLSGILASEVNTASQQEEPIDVGLLQSVHGTNGRTGVADMLQIFDQDVDFVTKESATRYSGFSHKNQFALPKPFFNRALRLTNFVERDILRRKGVLSNYWTAFDKESFNTLISFLKKIGFLKFFKHPKLRSVLGTVIAKEKQSTEHIALCARNARHAILLTLSSDYEATGSCAIAFSKLLLSGGVRCGAVKFPFEVFALDEITPNLDDVIIEIQHRPAHA